MQRISATPLGVLIESWALSLAARNVAASTQTVYRKSAEQLVGYLAEQGVTTPEEVQKRHVEGFISHLAETRSPATASIRYRALQQWFAWMVDEEEIGTDPMARMKRPIVPEQPVPVLETAQIRALLAACEGKEFADRRDSAIVHLFLDTGARLSELTGVTLDDVDLHERTVTILGKGRRLRTVAFGVKSARAVDRYLRSRARHKQAALHGLWLAERGGAMTTSGLAQAVKRRGELAGITRLHPHQLRHTSVHEWLSAGGAEGDAMQLYGWRSRQMLARYGASAAAERARAAHRRHGMLDPL